MNSAFIVNVDETNFEELVITYSHTRPVVVDFRADWCAPCKQLDPILEKLANESRGSFRLARLDVDSSQLLSGKYQISTVPTVISFSNGQPVDRFSGLLPENSIRNFISRSAPSANDLNLEKGHSLLNSGSYNTAKQSFENVLEDEPGNPSALIGLARCQIAEGAFEQALENLVDFPTSKHTADAENLLGLVNALMSKDFLDIPEEDEIGPAFLQALRLIELGNITAAMDGLLDVLKQDKAYLNGKAKEVFLALLQVLGEEHPDSRSYRSELASILF